MELMAEAGYPDGFTGRSALPERPLPERRGDLPGLRRHAGPDRDQRKPGQPVAHHPLPADPERETDFYLLGWGVPPFDSQYVFDFLVHSQEGAYGGWNGSRYSDPELDAKIKSLATETDLEARDATIAEIWEQVQEDGCS
jgi:peptide/nickel transport system substrate-binding protein